MQRHHSCRRNETVKAIKKFDEFVAGNIAKKQSADYSRAEFLIEESKRSYNNLLKTIEKLGLDEDTASLIVKSCYDVLMELIRAKMLLEGYNASGFGAHEAEVSYLRVLGFDENDVQFADQIRFFRNGTLYYGTIIDATYAKEVISFTKRIYPALNQMIRDKIR